jgi:hypothetical protein
MPAKLQQRFSESLSRQWQALVECKWGEGEGGAFGVGRPFGALSLKEVVGRVR